MIGRTNASGGGYNFRIIGGTSAPLSPCANDFWVNTDSTIMGFSFGVNAPEAKAGMLWIETGISSPVAFNALKNNALLVYPVSVKQYINGAWADKTAYIYLGGAWVEVITDTRLYFAGEFFAQYESVASNATVNYESDFISITTVANKESEGYVQIGPVDVTKYAYAEAVFVNDSGKSFNGCVFVSDTEIGSITYADKQKKMAFSSGEITVGLDLSNVTGQQYLYIGFNSGTTRFTSSVSGLKIKTIELTV